MPPSLPDISQRIQELKSTQSQVRFWRTLTIIAIILIVVTCVGLISTAVTQLATGGAVQEKFLSELTEGVNRELVPELQRLASAAAADIAPLVQAELNQLNLKAPDFAESLRKELHNLTVHVADRGEKVLDETFGSIIKKRQDWIEKTFEGVTKEKAQTMAENLNTIAHERIEHLSDTFFAEHIVALNRITENLHAIQQAELTNVRHEVPNWEMALLFFDIVRDELRGIETLNHPTGAIQGKVGGEADHDEKASDEK